MTPLDSFKAFLKLESAGGILLMIAAAAALAVANSPAHALYQAFIDAPVEVRAGPLLIAKPLLLWINDGLMAVFFLLVGLEIKREMLEGQLSSPAQVALPAIAALGGMLLPAAIYAFCNWGDPVAVRGWAIPAATDIAFALGVLALVGSGVPPGLKVFLLTLAILDDFGAIAIIALVYTDQLSPASLLVAAAALAALAVLNLRRVAAITPYLLAGAVLWVAVLKSGVHATLAGVALAFFIPMRGREEGDSPLRRLEHDLHPAVAYAILPLFAFANAGVSLAGVTPASILAPVPLGIAAGLFAGKTVGVFAFSWMAIRLGLARLPEGVTWAALLGVSMLCGVGFTMSLFIASLAFDQGGPAYEVATRIGILGGSLLSALCGYLVLRAVLRPGRPA
ncbi:MAG: Na+/H+ antiporter NhaA [Proteobacteria bacterium]|nr:Na+/H+ antiporter NhaA [Pseudomonadota bacterium]